MDNNIPDSGSIKKSNLYPKRSKELSVKGEEKDANSTADQISVSSEARAKNLESKKIGEWVDMLRKMPDDSDRIGKGKEALKEYEENPSQVIKKVAEKIKEEWTLTD